MNKKYILPLMSLIAGCLLPLAFAPFYLFPLAFLSVGLLFFILRFVEKQSQAFLNGWLYGLGMFGVGVSWVYISIHRFGGTNALLALLITGLFIAGLALFPAVLGWIFQFSGHSVNLRTGRDLSLRRSILFASLWTLFEWIRSWLFTGFPWLFLGYSQTNSWLRGYAPILGIYGVSFLVAWSGVLIFQIIVWGAYMRPIQTDLPHAQKLSFRAWPRTGYMLLIVAVIWGGGGILTQVHWTKKTGQPISVSIIQGNIPQQIKWLPSQIIPNIKKYERLTQAHWDSRIIVWPEAAITIPLLEIRDYIEWLLLQTKQHQANIILGIPIQTENQFYNSAIVVGDGTGIYLKRHLVPFGEYLPFERFLRGLIAFFDLPMSDFSKGPAQQALFDIKGVKIAPYICYEVGFPSLVRSDLPAANVLLTMSNDAWFGDSLAAWQHLQMGQMMALSAGRYMLFSTNNGVTAIIDFQGKIIKRLPRFKTDVLTGKINIMKGSTPWIKIGDWPVVSMSLLITLLFYFLKRYIKCAIKL
ncbi:MAG: apolipoprotein N-acyltransferase [Gammaproteobacteria bacterium]|nr:apolipoprotein N-acyltransferase [Gammaproteobacteria bacterium]